MHVTSGGIAMTHSMDFISNLAFKAQPSLLAVSAVGIFTDFVFKIRQGLFGGAICGRDASSHRLDYYKELPTWLFCARKKHHGAQENSSLNFKQKSV